MNTTIIPQQETFDFMKPDDIGAMDATEGLPFAPEIYYVRHDDKCLYAQGWVSVKGASYLTDGFLVGNTVECIEDDYGWITGGC